MLATQPFLKLPNIPYLKGTGAVRVEWFFVSVYPSTGDAAGYRVDLSNKSQPHKLSVYKTERLGWNMSVILQAGMSLSD